MTDANQHGLSRHIPADIARQIRQNAGFGCVLCGSAIYVYEHVDPEFIDAREHDPSKITLLCAGCHDRVTRGLLAKSTVLAAMQKPKCLQEGFSFGAFDVGTNHPVIHAGPVVARNVPVVLDVLGDPVLKVEPPETEGGPFRMSAFLADSSGREILSIEGNQWLTPASNWDVEITGRRIKINNAPREIGLILRTDPPTDLFVERLDMFHKGAKIKISEEEGLVVISPAGATLSTTDAAVDGSRIAISVMESGIAVGVGGGMVYMGRASFGR